MNRLQVPNHEHVDLLWGRDVDKLVIPKVLEALKRPSSVVAAATAALDDQGMDSRTPSDND